MTTRRVAIGRYSPGVATPEVRTALTFLCASIEAELRDIDRLTTRWSPSKGRPVPVDGIPAALLVHRANIGELVERIQREHCLAEETVREALLRDDEPVFSAERDQRTEDS